MTILQNRIEVIRADITKIPVDAIVNAANPSLMGGGGVDGAIHRVGGPSILEDCKKIIARQGSCKTGEAVITGAGNLPAKFIIHTVGPVWNGGNRGEKEKLKACYENSLNLATMHQVRTISFPNISTGVYGFPKDQAAIIASQTIINFLYANEIIQKTILVCFDEENFQLISTEIRKLTIT